MFQYDAKDVVVTYDGVYITGFAEEMVSGSKDEEFFSTSVGAQGDVVTSETNNPLGTISITLKKGSPQYRYLVNAGKNKTIAPLWVTNPVSGEKYGGTQARLKKFPDHTEGAEASDSAFEFQVFDYEEV